MTMTTRHQGPVDATVTPRYGGPATFARLPRLDEVERADVAILGVPFDSGVSYRPAGDEHGILSWDATAVENGPRVGEQIRLIPSHIDTTVNLHDGYHIVRNGTCNTYWPVAARGKVQ